MIDNSRAKEAVFLIDGNYFLHLREAGDDVGFVTFDKDTGKQLLNGLVKYRNLPPDGKNKIEAARNWYLFETIGGKYNTYQRVGVTSLENVRASGVHKRRIWDDSALPNDDIRLVDLRFNDLYHIPNGGVVQITFPDGNSFTEALYHIDDYHLSVGGAGNVMHIQEFYERFNLECGCTVYPELLTTNQKGAWRLIRYSKNIIIESCEFGWGYFICDLDYHLLFAGDITDPELTIEEAREKILASNHLQAGRRYKVDFDKIYGMMRE